MTDDICCRMCLLMGQWCYSRPRVCFRVDAENSFTSWQTSVWSSFCGCVYDV